MREKCYFSRYFKNGCNFKISIKVYIDFIFIVVGLYFKK